VQTENVSCWVQEGCNQQGGSNIRKVHFCNPRQGCILPEKGQRSVWARIRIYPGDPGDANVSIDPWPFHFHSIVSFGTNQVRAKKTARWFASRLQSLALPLQKWKIRLPCAWFLLLNCARAQAAVEEEAFSGCIRILELYEKERNIEATALSSPALKSDSSSSPMQGMEASAAQPSGGARFDLAPCARVDQNK